MGCRWLVGALFKYMSSEPTNKIDEVCSVIGCGNQLKTQGFCTACFYQYLRNGMIKKEKQPRNWRHKLTEINVDTKEAICSTCGPVKITKREKNKWRCSTENNNRSKLYKRSYRASKKAMLGPICEICNSDINLCWDHCHTSGEFRGTLCYKCNLGIGQFQDNIELLANAISYLKAKTKHIDETANVSKENKNKVS
jgi:hypothetical protein